MKQLSLLISPRAISAYFGDYLAVCRAELQWICAPESIEHKRVGSLDFFEIEAPEEQLPHLIRLSFVQGLFERGEGALMPLDLNPGFALHDDFIFGTKYRGKTNETLTQLLLNLALSRLGQHDIGQIKILDPMCGRGTTLLWAMRYGLKSKGIELNARVMPEIAQSLKKWCKIHRQKHKYSEGFVGGRSKKKGGEGRFINFAAEDRSFRIITGDSLDACHLLNNERFHAIVSDLPYGVQHLTRGGLRNPLDQIQACAPEWVESLHRDGIMVLAFNRNIPKRRDLIELFEIYGMQALEFNAPHRMSESIVRDILILQKSA